MAKLPPNAYINRELSWLSFNSRVLERAEDKGLPLLERVKFLGIVSSNLDEFFMVRVGGLQMLVEQDVTRPDPSGLTPQQQLEAIGIRVRDLVNRTYACYLEDVQPKLNQLGIRRVMPQELSDDQHRHIEGVFETEVYPILSPVALSSDVKFPLLMNRTLHLGVKLAPRAAQGGQPRFAAVPLAKRVNRFVTLPSEQGYQFILLEDVVAQFVHRLFAGEKVQECVPFRITRNADLGVREDLASDLLSEMEAVISARKRSDCVRLEIDAGASKATSGFLHRALEVAGDQTYPISGPLDLSAFMYLTELVGCEELKIKPWPPRPSPQVEPGATIFETVGKRDVLLYHPFESFEPVLRLVEEASRDPQVVAIKQILYRTSKNSPIVAALVRAARQGKYVTAVVELKARFDEERNIEWAKELEDAGVQVVYGVKNLKTHAKLCLVVRRGPGGLQRYCHFGTGNYNEISAQLYCDVSYLSANEDLAADASAFFNAITGYSQPQRFRKIDAAPLGLRERLVELIDNAAERKRQGQRAFIDAKINSLADPGLIAALYAASQAGVTVRLNVRGVCCLRPGVTGLSENISVVSIVDRFLEHARIIHVGLGREERLYISTADWMGRNLDRRVELLVPIEDPAGKARLIDILDTCFRDNVNAWKLRSDGSYERTRPTSGRKAFRSQEVHYDKVVEAVKQAETLRRTVLEPHKPQAAG